MQVPWQLLSYWKRIDLSLMMCAGYICLINLVELNATLKGINLALQWQATVHLKTDFLMVYHFLSNTLNGKAKSTQKGSRRNAD